MIGVNADFEERDAVREFFELFKTPWEFCRDLGNYDVVLCNGGRQFDGTAKLIVVYAGGHTDYDNQLRIQTGPQRKTASTLSYRGDRIPIYGNTITFPRTEGSSLTDEDSEEAVLHKQTSETAICRIGYDLFGEVRRLLTIGQPAANAAIPTLELHIALLRDLITSSGLSLVEIPPVPEGYNSIVCLTHDIDHPSIRRHVWDHTAFGFLYRAVVGSLRNLMRGRISVRELGRNWGAALMLPLVYCGLTKDFWMDFADSYLNLETGLKSTFFVIPFRDRAGLNVSGVKAERRAAKYAARDVADQLRKLQKAGCEIGLHGIDAWLNSSRGREELEEIRRLTGASEIGVRMHWLYYDQQSPVVLEKAGAAYDSTIGYNETVGYRAGTTQAYKPLQATQLLELPLHAMDTALFYPDYLGLSPRQATTVLGQLVDNAVQFGGCLTINWHDRSLAPERLWGACYRDLVQHLRSGRAWFATASEAVSWFQKRRSVVFETDAIESDAVHARVSAHIGDDLPGLRLRIYKPRELPRIDTYGSEEYVDMAFNETIDTRIDCVTRC